MQHPGHLGSDGQQNQNDADQEERVRDPAAGSLVTLARPDQSEYDCQGAGRRGVTVVMTGRCRDYGVGR
jgi:hypothetical protein